MKNSTKIWILVLSLLGIIIMGGSYAYFSAYATSEQQIIKMDVSEISYETGQDILIENALPQPLESLESSSVINLQLEIPVIKT